MNLYNLNFWMVILIPFLTQPPHERTQTGRGSRVYPNVGAAGCTLTSGQPGVAWSGQEVCSGFALAARAARSQLGLRPRGLLYELVQYNLYKKCMNCMNLYYTICICINLYKKRTNYIIRIGMYVFILANLYKQIIEKKDLHPVGISTRDQYPRLKSSRSTVHHRTPSVSGHFIYIP